MEWSQKRKTVYALVFVAVVILLAAYPTYKLVYHAPTCFDGKQNGVELGMDCGGTCALYCASQITVPRVVWAKAFPVSGEGVYDLGAYIENPNGAAGLKGAHYTMRMLGSAGQDFGSSEGTMEIAPNGALLLFVPNVRPSGVPDRVQVEFNKDDMNKWVKARAVPEVIMVKNQTLRNTDTKPRFDATLVNTDRVNDIGRVILGGVVYDALKNPIAVSETFVDGITRGAEENIVFTWQNRFTKNPRGGMCATPVDTMLVFDRSGSMNVGAKNPPEPLTTAKNAAVAYLESSELEDHVGLISFAGTASNPIDKELSGDPEGTKAAILNIAISKDGPQYTNLGDALKGALNEFRSTRHNSSAKSAIIVLTDGVANRPLDPVNAKNTSYAEEYAAAYATEARKMGVEVYAIGLGASFNETYLRDRIATTPADYFTAPTAADLETIYKKISETVCKEESFIKDVIIRPRTIFTQ